MALPKSIVKVTKNKKNGQVELSYTNNVDRTNYTIRELTKAALRDVSKLILKELPENSPKRTGNLSKSFASWNRGIEQGLQIGTYYSKQKAESKKKGYAPYLHLILFPKTNRNGTKTQGNNFFKDVVYRHIDDIRTIEGKYLSAIEDEREAEQLVNEPIPEEE